ncbi:hypothetical protein FHU28_000373 [Micromonospora echinospora]|uniref:Uncharacterized protein n=1 Tax=Micromonospora echinospora TaxID=1877 RepID=A0ABR6M585_MICEC|nr:hypothetical protein [Micromonospora echinospora]
MAVQYSSEVQQPTELQQLGRDHPELAETAASRSRSHRSELRIRRLGVRVPSGAQTIKAVTSGNASHGLDRFCKLGPVFPGFGIWCSDGAPLSVCCSGGGLCRLVLTRAFACRLVWIMVGMPVRQGAAAVHCGRGGGSLGPRWAPGRSVAVDLGWRR